MGLIATKQASSSTRREVKELSHSSTNSTTPVLPLCPSKLSFCFELIAAAQGVPAAGVQRVGRWGAGLASKN